MVGLHARAGNRETVVCWHREGFRRFWDLAIAGARARRTSFSIERNPSARMPHGESQSVMGVRRASTASSPSSGSRSRSARSAGFCRAAGVRGRSGGAGSWRTKLVFWPRWISSSYRPRHSARSSFCSFWLASPAASVHFAVTDSPSAAWTAQQLAEPIPWEEAPWCLIRDRSEEHTSELQSHLKLVCRLLLEKKKIDLLCLHRGSRG